MGEGKLLTNREGSKTDPEFLEACKRANIQPTIRQYSKWRNGHGAAFVAKKAIAHDE
jgi:hypothetical protein